MTQRRKRNRTQRQLRLARASLREQLLTLMAHGVTTTAACEELDLSLGTVQFWVRSDDEFKEQYRKAREDQALALADRALDIAFKPAKDLIEVKDKDVMVKAIQWFTAKSAPRLFAERLQHDHSAHVGVIVLPPLDYSQQPISALHPNDQIKTLPPPPPPTPETE